MKYIDTAFGQLAFAWKLYNYGLEGKIDLADLDKPITFQEGHEAGVALANPIQTEIDQFSSLTYQIRNAFAHDISEPRWNITNPRYARVYEFGGIRVDLTNVGNKHFEYTDIGGPDVLFHMREFGASRVWP
ncbi:hypothetical protein [Lysobacter hankyongensis]|uniref:Uncharacterized protein n=1 Tax=Lysobacter hankyongensis TaxID=1176535 RepID=A0ABP9BP92_9GAMM